MRRAVRSDVPFIMALEKGAIDHPWQEQDIIALVEDANKICLVETDTNGEITGYIGCDWVLDEASIGNIVVSPEHRRQGIGAGLISGLLSMLKDLGITVIFLEVRFDNEAAIALYTGLGFEVYNRRRDYYGKGIDALLMKKLI